MLTGGRRPPTLKRGFFYEPTVLVNVDHTMRIMREETFGPTMPIMTYRTFDEAIQLANDSPFGLGANLYSLQRCAMSSNSTKRCRQARSGSTTRSPTTTPARSAA